MKRVRMHTLFWGIGMHASLGHAVEQTGGNRFWRQLILLLRQRLPFDDALAIFYSANGMLVALGEYDVEPHAEPASMLTYLNGLYLLDPFYQACWEGLASDLYRLEGIAPGHFRQSKYCPSYFHDNVLEDEMQLILRVPGQGALSLSLGMQRMFADEGCEVLGLLPSWILVPMQQHWQQRNQRLLSTAPQEETTTQIRDVPSHFGASMLSGRELEVARLILRGCSSRAMTERLAISPETIKICRCHLYARPDISSRPELFSLFIQSLGHGPGNP